MAENGSVVELGPNGVSIVDQIEAGVTLVDGLGVGDIGDVALRDRRHMAEDGVLIIVATLASQNGRRSAAAEVIARGFAETRAAARRDARGGGDGAPRVPADGIVEIKLLQEHLHDGVGQLVYDRTKRRPMILPVVVEVVSARPRRLGGRAGRERRRGTNGAAPDRAALGVRGRCAFVLPAAGALGPRRGRSLDAGRAAGSAAAGGRARRNSARRAGAAARAVPARARAGHGRGALVVRRAGSRGSCATGGEVLERAGVSVSPVRVAQAYLELAVLVRALEGLRAAADIGSEPDRSSLWAGLFDLRENLLGRDARRPARALPPWPGRPRSPSSGRSTSTSLPAPSGCRDPARR